MARTSHQLGPAHAYATGSSGGWLPLTTQRCPFHREVRSRAPPVRHNLRDPQAMSDASRFLVENLHLSPLNRST
jgi:hypothetical protein